MRTLHRLQIKKGADLTCLGLTEMFEARLLTNLRELSLAEATQLEDSGVRAVINWSVMSWCHDRETLPTLLCLRLFVRGQQWQLIPLTKGQWCGPVIFSLLLAWKSSWTNSWEKWSTLTMQAPDDWGKTRSISWLLMPWPLVSPGDHQPEYWPYIMEDVLVFLCNRHIEVETKWLPFSRPHFQMHFLEWKCVISN